MDSGVGVKASELIRLARPDWVLLLGATVCLIIAAIGESYIPTLTGGIVDLVASPAASATVRPVRWGPVGAVKGEGEGEAAKERWDGTGRGGRQRASAVSERT